MKNKMQVLGNIYCAGCYGMRCKDSQEYLYIGSALEINDALSRHLYYLKRGFYENTNKVILQETFDLGELVFEVIKESCHDGVNEMTPEKKESLHKALSVLEQFYINLYKDSICNAQRTVKKHSSNSDKLSTYKRSIINRGSKNPNSRYNEKVVAEILFLKLQGYKPKDIIVRYQGLIDQNYISRIGIDRYINLEPVKPDWYDEAV